jgi:hypothetical protein
VFLASGPDLIEQVRRPGWETDLLRVKARFGVDSASSSNLKARVASYAPVMAEQTEQMLACWTPGRSVQIDYEFEAMTSKIALKALFDLDDLGDGERFSDTRKLAISNRGYNDRSYRVGINAVRLGSLADLRSRNTERPLYPKNGHAQHRHRCLQSAKSDAVDAMAQNANP